MNKEQFTKFAEGVYDTFAVKMHTWHQDKAASWQFLIQLNTKLPYDSKLTYGLPLEMSGMEDSEEKTRSIILWRLLQNNVPVETIVFAAGKIDELRGKL